MSEAEARRLLEAYRCAEAGDLPFLRSTTVHWTKAGVRFGEGDWATRVLLDKVRRSMDKRGLPFAYVWTREDGGPFGHGDHAHIHWHGTYYRGLAHAMRRWIAEIGRVPYVSGTILTHTIGLNLKSHITLPDTYQANLVEVRDYILKGVSSQTAARLGLSRCEAGGTVIGQRYGISANLRRKMREQV